MDFPNTYFDDEVKNGFYIPAIMKRNFASQIEVLNDIDIVCQKYGLKYFAEWGTMLGAIRHEGIIPWDDDIDIAMPRADYTKFCEVVEKELGGEYFLMTWATHEEFEDSLAHLYNANHITFFPEFLKKYHGFPYMSGVDIFPIDYIPRDEEAGRRVMEKAQMIHSLAIGVGKVEGVNEIEVIEYVEELCGVSIPRDIKNLRTYLMNLCDKLFGSFSDEESDMMGSFSFYFQKGIQAYPKEIFDEIIRVPFENTTIPIVASYNKLLTQKYGDYFKTRKHTSAHDYPSYAPQEKMLKAETGGELPKFHITKDMVNNRIKKQKKVNRDYKEVVFYVLNPSTWNVFDIPYRAIMNDPNTMVYVIPMTYYHKDIDGNPIDVNCVLDGYPEHVLIYGHDDYDVEAHHPDQIYIQIPFDNWNFSLSVHPDYFSQRLAQYTEELIYIPFFVMDELTDEDECGCYWVDSHAIQPALLYADKVILQSSNMRKYYIDALVGEVGNVSKNYWKKKLTSKELEFGDISLPEIGEKRGSAPKQILVYFDFATFYENGRCGIEKVRKTIDVFKKNPEVVMRLWVPPLLIENMKKYISSVADEYIQIIQEAMDSDFILVDNTGEKKYAIDECEAFYGDPCCIAKEMEGLGKPIMIESVLL